MAQSWIILPERTEKGWVVVEDGSAKHTGARPRRVGTFRTWPRATAYVRALQRGDTLGKERLLRREERE